MRTFDIYFFIGLAGGCLLLFGFYRISIGRWTNKSFWYELDNVLGAAFLAIYQFHLRAYISVVVNTVWAVVAVRGLSSFKERYQWGNKRSKRRRKKKRA